MSNANNVKKFSNNDYIFVLFGNMFHILVSGCQLEYSIFQSGLNFVNLKCQLVETSNMSVYLYLPSISTTSNLQKRDHFGKGWGPFSSNISLAAHRFGRVDF